MLSIRELNIWYSHLHAVKNVNLEIEPKKITAFIGASGSGKSTLLRSLNRMLDHLPKIRVEGAVALNGYNVLDEGTDVVSLRRNVGMVFQNPTPFPKSIYDNVAYGLEIQGIKNRRRSWVRRQRIDADEVQRSHDPLDQAVVRSLKEAALWDEVSHRLHHSAYRLSGGQQQRLCIARAIAVQPDVLLLDEPCSQLDPISTRHIEELLLQLKKDYTIVIVTHNMHQAKRIADKVGFFHAGELVEFAPVERLFGHPSQALTKEYVMGAFG
jgi:phosphate transport system ATP-binding protein